MTALTSDLSVLDIRDASVGRYQTVDGTKYFRNQLCGLSSAGKVIPFDGTANTRWLGPAVAGIYVPANQFTAGFDGSAPFMVKGDDSQSVKPCVEISLTARIVRGYGATSGVNPGTAGTINGLAGTLADVGAYVYAASDDHTLTITRPAAKPFIIVGEVAPAADNTYQTTSTDILFYAPSFVYLLNRDGVGGGRTMYLGSIRSDDAAASYGGATKNLRNRGRFTRLYLVCEQAPAGGTSSTIQLQVGAPGATATVTGGIATMLAADAVGALKDGATAISAGGDFGEGDAWGYVIVGGAPATGGRYGLFVEFTPLDSGQ